MQCWNTGRAATQIGGGRKRGAEGGGKGGGWNLLVESLHGQQAGLRLLGALLGGLGSGEGFAVQGGEVGLGPQEARHEEVEEGPQLQHIVLDGGARQDEAVLRHHSLAGLQHWWSCRQGQTQGGGVEGRAKHLYGV